MFDHHTEENDADTGYAPWPHPGTPQLWERAALHAAENDGDPGPHVVHHQRPTLSEGAQGEHVVELVRLLKNLGYADNTIARGQNFANVLDVTVMADVWRFCRDYGVINDIGEFAGREKPAKDFVDTHVGPYIWEALYRLQDPTGEIRHLLGSHIEV